MKLNVLLGITEFSLGKCSTKSRMAEMESDEITFICFSPIHIFPSFFNEYVLICPVIPPPSPNCISFIRDTLATLQVLQAISESDKSKSNFFITKNFACKITTFFSNMQVYLPNSSGIVHFETKIPR